MNIWPSPGKGPTSYYEFTQCLLFKCTTFTSPIYHLPTNHRAFAHAVTFREKNFSSLRLAFYSFSVITFLLTFISHTSQLYRVSHLPWISRYKITFWVQTSGATLHLLSILKMNKGLLSRLWTLQQQRPIWSCSGPLSSALCLTTGMHWVLNKYVRTTSLNKMSHVSTLIVSKILARHIVIVLGFFFLSLVGWGMQIFHQFPTMPLGFFKSSLLE